MKKSYFIFIITTLWLCFVIYVYATTQSSHKSNIISKNWDTLRIVTNKSPNKSNTIYKENLKINNSTNNSWTTHISTGYLDTKLINSWTILQNWQLKLKYLKLLILSRNNLKKENIDTNINDIDKEISWLSKEKLISMYNELILNKDDNTLNNYKESKLYLELDRIQKSKESVDYKFRIDCGTININWAIIKAPKLTDSTKLAIKCINEAIVRCKWATVKIWTWSSINIIDKENDTCIIENKLNYTKVKKSGFEYYTICKFPMEKFIVNQDKQLSLAWGNTFLWMSLPFIKFLDDVEKDKNWRFDNEASLLNSEEKIQYKCK